MARPKKYQIVLTDEELQNLHRTALDWAEEIKYLVDMDYIYGGRLYIT